MQDDIQLSSQPIQETACVGYSQNKLSVYSQCRAKMIPCVYHIRKLANMSELATAIASSTSSSMFLDGVVHT